MTDLIRSIYDPEHPNTLEELRVVSAPQVTIGANHVKVEFTPTVPHCGMSTLIGVFQDPPDHPPCLISVCSPFMPDCLQVSAYAFDFCGACLNVSRSIYSLNPVPIRVKMLVSFASYFTRSWCLRLSSWTLTSV